MIFETRKNSIKANVIGYRLNEGDYNGKHYRNYILTLAQTISKDGEGVQCVEMTLPESFDPEKYYRENVEIQFRFFRDAKRQKVDDIEIL